MKERELAKGFIDIEGIWTITVHRHDGRIEREVKRNIVTANGLNAMANRVIADTTSRFGFIGIGTATTGTFSLDGDVTSFGEVDRKAPTTVTSSREIFYMVATWGGAADSISSLAIAAAAMLNHVNSGLGTALNLIGFGPHTLADSDFLSIETRVRVGSHNV